MDFTPEQLRGQLVGFHMAEWGEFSDELCQYRQHYGLDFDLREQKPIAVEHKIGWFDCYGYRLVVQHWKLTKSHQNGTWFINHGYYDHLGIYRHIIEFALENGFDVIAYDLPGHGLSSGDRASINSFDQYDQIFLEVINHVKREVDGPLYCVGQSTGGAIIISYLLGQHLQPKDNPFAGIFLLAPLVRPHRWWLGQLTYWLMKPFVKSKPRTFSVNSSDQEFLEFLQFNDPLQPLALKVDWVSALREWIAKIRKYDQSLIPIHIVQGTADETVDWRYNVKFLQKRFKRVTIHWLEGGRHQLVNESESIRANYFNWLLKQIKLSQL